MSLHIVEGEEITDANWVSLCADEEHGITRRCQCGRLIFSKGLACELCDPESVSFLLRRQAA